MVGDGNEGWRGCPEAGQCHEAVVLDEDSERGGDEVSAWGESWHVDGYGEDVGSDR